ncbi:hypothetical protein GALMADRAFT_869696 [Galerina marginata CBS 339.88]|uniref:F-box domain-containing protein n=1 Tax=Galerina marginata (strain CBS 339.88) TaxID=685588 RepID=A0A067TVS2_GALM3|nr:hypothetical protein GALMADRAFT_869696 [Galerina marginata CBS 339.88]
MDTLEKLVQSNNPPSEATILKVNELLSTPLKDLNELDVEILQFERHLLDLKAKRVAVQDTVKKYTSIISIVRRIPIDILHQIFYHCLPTHRNPVMAASEAPLLLTRICSSWRATALSSPRIWARLHIPFSDEHLFSDEQSHRPYFQSNQKAAESLQLRCRIIKEWLDRSGTCPLSISIHFSSPFWRTRNPSDAESSDITQEFFRILVLQSQRWENLELIMPMEIYLKLESMISNDMLPMLKSFKAILHLQRPGAANIGPPFSLPKAPNLLTVSLSAGTACFWKSPNPPIIWSRLTYLSVHTPFSITDILDLLKTCNGLVHCEVNIMDGVIEDQPDLDLQEQVSLPSLRSFSILEDGMNPPRMRNLYNCIHAPELRWISYRKMNHIQEDMDDMTPSPILSLLQKSAKLKKLTVSPRGFSRWNMRRILEIISANVTHLVLGHEPFAPSRSMGQGIRFFGPDMFDFDNLSCFYSSPIGGTSTILPHLRILEITYGTTVSDKDLLQFIIGRMDLLEDAPTDVAALDCVRVNFSRPREKNSEVDIDEDVSRHARLLGRKIKLELNYIEEPRNANTMSSSYGLTDQDQWWTYDEIEEGAVPED